MRSTDDDMEIAVDVPRLRAVPSVGSAPPLEDASDAELLARIGARDRAAFELLYSRYVRSVFGLALRRLGDRHRAEDAVQEAFTAVWRSAKSYRPERGPAAGWLYTVARNAIVDGFRRNRSAADVELPELVSSEPGPPEQAEESYAAWRVHRALEELPEREREIIELAYWSGLTQTEVANFLGVPLGTVKTRNRAALARLATLLERDLR